MCSLFFLKTSECKETRGLTRLSIRNSGNCRAVTAGICMHGSHMSHSSQELELRTLLRPVNGVLEEVAPTDIGFIELAAQHLLTHRVSTLSTGRK